jgi:HPt (histidine-containing phosphotransfer) domain-containing protein
MFPSGSPGGPSGGSSGCSVCGQDRSAHPLPGAPGSRADLPLADPAVLEDLVRQLGNPSPALAFARDFVHAWHGKFERLETALQLQDDAGALDAALSLKTTSNVVGAPRLAQLAADVEQLLLRSDLETATGCIDRIRACGEATTRELADRYHIAPLTGTP